MVEITDQPIDMAALVHHVSSCANGAVVTFQGVVRNATDGRPVVRLEYHSYREMALNVMAQVEREIADRFGVVSVAIVHRVGSFSPGETVVAIAVASPHRAEAFAACSYAIDRVKQVVPIWKKEHFEEGAEWVAGNSPI
jgi:molybdopterin synthase catalytic subunit